MWSKAALLDIGRWMIITDYLSGGRPLWTLTWGALAMKSSSSCREKHHKSQCSSWCLFYRLEILSIALNRRDEQNGICLAVLKVWNTWEQQLCPDRDMVMADEPQSMLWIVSFLCTDRPQIVGSPDNKRVQQKNIFCSQQARHDLSCVTLSFFFCKKQGSFVLVFPLACHCMLGRNHTRAHRRDGQAMWPSGPLRLLGCGASLSDIHQRPVLLKLMIIWAPGFSLTCLSSNTNCCHANVAICTDTPVTTD